MNIAKTKNLYMPGILRQEFITGGNCIDTTNCSISKDSEPYKDIGSITGQATLRTLDKNWKSFFKSIKVESTQIRIMVDLNTKI